MLAGRTRDVYFAFPPLFSPLYSSFFSSSALSNFLLLLSHFLLSPFPSPLLLYLRSLLTIPISPHFRPVLLIFLPPFNPFRCSPSSLFSKIVLTSPLSFSPLLHYSFLFSFPLLPPLLR